MVNWNQVLEDERKHREEMLKQNKELVEANKQLVENVDKLVKENRKSSNLAIIALFITIILAGFTIVQIMSNIDSMNEQSFNRKVDNLEHIFLSICPLQRDLNSSVLYSIKYNLFKLRNPSFSIQSEEASVKLNETYNMITGVCLLSQPPPKLNATELWLEIEPLFKKILEEEFNKTT